jgi:hypothetical protein
MVGGRRRIVVAAAMTLAAVLTASAAGGASSAVRATLVSSARPHALAVLTGTISGRTLAWRLSHHGLGRAPLTARLLVAGRSLKLCGPCGASASGKLTLTAAAVGAARKGSARVDLRSSRASIRGPLALGAVPTIQLVGLADGATLQLPAVVHYTVTGFRVAPGAGKVVAYNGGQQIAADSGTGTITLPDDKMLTGVRDLSFALVPADGAPLTNREARTTVYDVLLAGRR